MVKKKSEGKQSVSGRSLKPSERKEAWIRIVVLIVSGIVIYVWKVFVQVLMVINWIYAVFSGKRMKSLADLSEIWNTQNYVFMRYMIFESNERPFPFRDLQKSMSKFQK